MKLAHLIAAWRRCRPPVGRPLPRRTARLRVHRQSRRHAGGRRAPPSGASGRICGRHAGLTPKGRFLAAVKACGEGAVLSHFSAAALWELLPWDEARPPDVIARADRQLRGATPHRPGRPPNPVRYDNIPVTTPARTLIDLSSMLPFKPLRRAIREATAR